MFDAIRNNKRIAQVILGILIVPFAAFFGVDYFGNNQSGGTVATVGGAPILQRDFDRLLSESQADRNSDEQRQAVLEQLIQWKLLELYAADMRQPIGDAQLQQAIVRTPDFQVNGQFSPDLYQKLVRQPSAYEARVRQQLRDQQLEGLRFPFPVARDSVRRLLAAWREERLVREMRFPVAPYLVGIKIDDAAIQKYYNDNLARFERPERIKAEYVVLAENSEEEIKAAHEAGNFVTEERRIRHILLELASDADEAAVSKTRQEIEEIAAALRKDPKRFPEFAREKSQDISSKDGGGDLGYISRGSMEPTFDEAAFTLKQDEISAPVRTEYGFHIIQSTDMRKPSLADARDEIIAGLRKQKQAAGQDFVKDLEKFSEIVFDQEPDSLKPAADAFGLKIRQSDWIDRGTDTVGEFHKKELVDELFSNDALEKHHNTRPVGVDNDVWVAARVLEREAARRLTLDEVRAQIEAQLRREEAARLAQEKGRGVLAALDRGEPVSLAWSTAHAIQRHDRLGLLPPEAMRAVFAAPVTKLPARVGVALPDDAFVVYQIDAVEHSTLNNDDPELTALSEGYSALLTKDDYDTFLATLRARYKIEINLPPRQTEE
ncbi:MAG: SurA N-terminal domain-containing protein [Azoarcus sp.]|jgi:peptidyl-prolyl cis-trans isomerase D|nr:SurA N-terminal domain-containing protein [Azoarcus sp.]